ncbi:hypothetical protein HG531_003452 [Fusarium graminearum]|nr:hypothetical protein HG531_003452 [Fusarium graminearum]
MNGNAAVKVGLCGTHLDSDAKALQHLTAANSHNVQTNNLLLGASCNKLVVDLDVVLAVLLDSLGLCQANAADLGVREYNGGDVAVVELKGGKLGTAEQTMRETASSSNGNGCQFNLSGNVAKSVDAVDVGVLVFIDNNVSRLGKLNSSLLQTDPLGLRGSADSPDQVVDIADNALVALVVLVCDGKLTVGVLLDLAGLRTLVKLNAESLVLLGNRLLDHGVEVAEEGIVADEEVSLCAKGVEHASELDSDVTRTDNGDLLGLCGNVEETITVGAILGAGNLGRNGGLASNSDKNLLGVDQNFGVVVECDLGLVLGGEAGPTVYVIDLVVVEVSLVNTVQALDVSVTLGLEGGPVEGSCLLDGEAIGFGIVDGLGKGGSVVTSTGYAPNVDTSSTKSLVLDNGSFDAKLVAGHARRGKSSTTTANDEVIGLLVIEAIRSGVVLEDEDSVDERKEWARACMDKGCTEA